MVEPPLPARSALRAAHDLERFSAARIVDDLWRFVQEEGLEWGAEMQVRVNGVQVFEAGRAHVRKGLLQYGIAALVSISVGVSSWAAGLWNHSPASALAGLAVAGLAWDGPLRALRGRPTKRVARKRLERKDN